MNIFGKTCLLLLLAAMLASCNSVQSTPTRSNAAIMDTAISTVSTTLAETQRAAPANTPLPTLSLPTTTPTLTPLPSPTGTPIFPPIESFAGIWRNVDGNTTSWAKIEITNNEDTLSARLVLLCTLTEEEMLLHYPDELICGEESTSATYSGNPVLMIIDSGATDSGAATYTITLSLDRDTLHVTTFTDYANSGIADETLEDDFRNLASFPVSDEIFFYHFVAGPLFHRRVPGGSVRTEASSDRQPVYLFPASLDEPYTPDTAADLRAALVFVLEHEANLWMSRDLEIADLTFRDGHADIVLQGQYSGESDDVLNAASVQILMTVFANPAVQSAVVTLNGDTIANLGVSSSTDASPADYIYTRAEIETYLKEHAFVQP